MTSKSFVVRVKKTNSKAMQSNAKRWRPYKKMTDKPNIIFELTIEEKQLIKQVSGKLGFTMATFVRTSAIQQAMKLKKDFQLKISEAKE